MEKQSDQEMFLKVIDDIKILIKMKEQEKIQMNREGRNKGIEYGIVVNQLSTLENSLRNIMLFVK